MIILSQNSTGFKIIPIEQNADGYILKIANETTKEITTFSSVTNVTENDVLKFQNVDFTFLTEDTFYELKVLDNNLEIVYRDLIFCTNQNLANYKMNQNITSLNTEQNTYITI